MWYLKVILMIYCASAIGAEDYQFMKAEQVIPITMSQGYARIVEVMDEDQVEVIIEPFKLHQTYKANDLHLAQGCWGTYCVGDKVIPLNYDSGFAYLVAFQPKQKMFTVVNDLTGKYERYHVDYIAKANGCPLGEDYVCVGDFVYPLEQQQVLHKVYAIQEKSGILVTKKGSQYTYYHFPFDKVAIPRGCMKDHTEICVGEKVMLGFDRMPVPKGAEVKAISVDQQQVIMESPENKIMYLIPMEKLMH